MDDPKNGSENPLPAESKEDVFAKLDAGSEKLIQSLQGAYEAGMKQGLTPAEQEKLSELLRHAAKLREQDVQGTDILAGLQSGRRILRLALPGLLRMEPLRPGLQTAQQFIGLNTPECREWLIHAAASGLLIMERIDRIQLGGLVRRIKAEEDADDQGKEKCGGHGRHGDNRRPADQPGEQQ